jgi:GDP-L-fucose synthase
MEPGSRIYVAGHRGLAGSAIERRLARLGYTNRIVRSSAELDLRRQSDVERFFAAEKPEYVFLAAAKVGGILANTTYPADFIYENLVIQTNVIDSARRYGARKLLFLGSSCIYPRNAKPPVREEYLLTGELEPTNQWYAVAKIAGIKLCQALRRQYGFSSICLMPTNLYGPGDNYHPQNAHVLAALLQRFHEARIACQPKVVVWGSGKPRREFLHVDDLAEAAVFAMQHYDSGELLNVGTGNDISIAELALLIARITDYHGEIVFDTTKPDGVPSKTLDTSRLTALGWKPKIDLEEGIRRTYEYFQAATAVS